MNLLEFTGNIVQFLFFNEIANFIMIVLSILGIVSLLYLAIFYKSTFTKTHRIGFILIIIGYMHWISQRLSAGQYIDDFLLIDVPLMAGRIFIELGIAIITILSFYRILLNFYRRNKNE